MVPVKPCFIVPEAMLCLCFLACFFQLVDGYRRMLCPRASGCRGFAPPGNLSRKVCIDAWCILLAQDALQFLIEYALFDVDHASKFANVGITFNAIADHTEYG